MHPPEIERHGPTPLERISPRWKLFSALAIITFTALLPRRVHPLYLFPAIIVLLLWPLCRMPLRYTLRRLLVVEVFILGIALLSLVRPAAAPVFFSSLLKSNLCVFAMLLLTWTTPFEDILQELRRVRFNREIASPPLRLAMTTPTPVGEKFPYQQRQTVLDCFNLASRSASSFCHSFE